MLAVESTFIGVDVVSERDARLLVLAQPHALSDAQRLDNHLLIARAVNIRVKQPLTAGVGVRRCNSSEASALVKHK